MDKYIIKDTFCGDYAILYGDRLVAMIPDALFNELLCDENGNLDLEKVRKCDRFSSNECLYIHWE